LALELALKRPKTRENGTICNFFESFNCTIYCNTLYRLIKFGTRLPSSSFGKALQFSNPDSEPYYASTITNREVQNPIKHFCSATTAQHRLKQFSAVEIVNPSNAIPIFWRVKVKQTYLPEGCQ
jgi:hypothetical protein